MAPQISIILPTFNGEKYICDAVNSCLNQTFTDFELIIVNDCSTDSTSSIIESFASKDNRIQIINNTSNQKLPKSLNIGFKRAAGKYYTWTSDDNIFDKNALEILHEKISKANSLDIIYTAYKIIDDQGNFVTNYGDFPEQLIFQNVVGACFLFKKEVYNHLNGFDESKYRVEDYDFWLRAIKHFKFDFVNQILYTYRRHSTSISSEIYSNSAIFDDFRSQHEQLFQKFYAECFLKQLTEEELRTLTMIYFNIYLKENVDLTLDHYAQCIKLIDKLKQLDWNKLPLNSARIMEVLEAKKDSFTCFYIRDLFYWKNEYTQNKTWFRPKYITSSFWLKKTRNYFYKVANQTK